MPSRVATRRVSVVRSSQSEYATGVTSSTVSATNDYTVTSGTGSCTGFASAGPDLVYVLTPTQTKAYTLTLTPTGSYDAVLYVLQSCPASSTIATCTSGCISSSASAATSVPACCRLARRSPERPSAIVIEPDGPAIATHCAHAARRNVRRSPSGTPASASGGSDSAAGGASIDP